MKKTTILIAFALVIGSVSITFGQDSTHAPAVKGGIYDRPYLLRPSSRIAIGGYAEVMLRSEYKEGVHENISFEARRFNIFFFSSIASSIKLTAELEFEHGTEEIKFETALVDVDVLEQLTLRAGILLSPVGKFNISHDSPRNEFNDRPLVSTRIIPSTLSEAGFGPLGSFYPFDGHRFTYELYLVNGFTDGVILAGDGTSIPEGRPEFFEEDNNGNLAATGRVAWIPDFGLELGASFHNGAYNTFVVDGLTVDERRTLTLLVLDGEYHIGDFSFQGEYAHASIGVPPSLVGLYAQRQQGYYAQATFDLFHNVLPRFPQSTVMIGMRYDMIDLDAEVHGDDTKRITIGTNLRLVPETVIKLDYQHNWIKDRIGNETRAAVIQCGLATYF